MNEAGATLAERRGKRVMPATHRAITAASVFDESMLVGDNIAAKDCQSNRAIVAVRCGVA